jgi:hypothetical protein
VRQEWSPEELLANWTLVDGDWDLMANKSGATRLGFSLSSANTVLHYGKDGALTGPDKEHAETSMLVLRGEAL